MPSNEGPKDDNNLSSFIEKNHKLITVLGVLTGLTVFANSLPLKRVASLLSFLFLTLTILVWFELWRRFPPGPGSWRLSMFESILSFAILGVVAYWFLQFHRIWPQLLVVPIFGVTVAFLSGVFSWAMKKFDIFNRVFHTKPGERKGLRSMLGIAVLLVVVGIGLVLSSILSIPLNHLLNSLHQGFESGNP